MSHQLFFKLKSFFFLIMFEQFLSFQIYIYSFFFHCWSFSLFLLLFVNGNFCAQYSWTVKDAMKFHHHHHFTTFSKLNYAMKKFKTFLILLLYFVFCMKKKVWEREELEMMKYMFVQCLKNMKLIIAWQQQKSYDFLSLKNKKLFTGFVSGAIGFAIMDILETSFYFVSWFHLHC
jgi:hypothetical protein